MLGERRGKPVGIVRITATEHAVRTLVCPRLLPWLSKYHDINIEISSDNWFTDIVAERFDIGIRLGDDVAKDMIAVRIAPDMRIVVVGSPRYFARHPMPRSPLDLTDQDCITLRLPTHGGLLPWEFKQGERTQNVHVKGRLVFNNSDLIVAAALAGYGLAWIPEDLIQKFVAAGRLLTVLDDWSSAYPGYHLHYASRRSLDLHPRWRSSWRLCDFLRHHEASGSVMNSTPPNYCTMLRVTTNCISATGD
jgi:DNA-binding transcriptional LysR family regulator